MKNNDLIISVNGACAIWQGVFMAKWIVTSHLVAAIISLLFLCYHFYQLRRLI
jgi:hypothetical protein